MTQTLAETLLRKGDRFSQEQTADLREIGHSGRIYESQCCEPDGIAHRFALAGEAWEELHRLRGRGLDSIATHNGNTILQTHKAIVAGPIEPTVPQYGHNGDSVTEMPYWELPPSAHGLSCWEIPGGIKIRSGRFGDFPLAARAVLVDAGARVYTDHLLQLGAQAERFGSESGPRWQQTQELQFIGTVAKEFRADHVVAAAFADIPGVGEVALGSVGAARGVGHRRLFDTIGHDGLKNGPPSSIPTNFALKYTPTPEALEAFGDVQEGEAVEPTRLASFTMVKPLGEPLAANGLLNKMMPVALYSGIFDGVKTQEGVTTMIYNTQPGLRHVLTGLGFPVVTVAETSEPTYAVMSTIHGHYFRHCLQPERRIGVPVVQGADYEQARRVAEQLKERLRVK